MEDSTTAAFIGSSYVYIVDDEESVREAISFLLTSAGYQARCFSSAAEFMAARALLRPGAVLLDLRMPETDGLGVIAQSPEEVRSLYPMIMMTGEGDLATAVDAMKMGAEDFLEKPFDAEALIKSLNQALSKVDAFVKREENRRQLRITIDRLTPRERDVLGLLVNGMSNKHAALELGISFRTVEMHRARMFQRLGVKTLADAVKLAMQAGVDLWLPA